MHTHFFAQSVRLQYLPACKPLVVAVALALAAPHAVLAVPPVTALPTGETLGANTVAQITRTGGSAPTMVIDQASRNAVIDWSTFSIGSQASVTFRQPTGGVALNRVGGSANPSEIYGALNATGTVFLVNPSGILFGPSASVNVGSLVASTLGMTDSNFATGNGNGAYVFSGAPAGVGVTNQGRLNAAAAGTIALLGATVSNTGTITGQLGRVALAAGDQVTVDFSGDGLTKLTVSGGDLATLVSNGGAIVNDGGEVTMTAASAGQLAQVLIGTGGTVQARSLTTRNGRIILEAGTTGEVDVAGRLDVSGTAAGVTGGAVQLQAGSVHLDAGAVIDARGNGGGSVNVFATDSTADSAGPTLTMAPTATIDASATGAGAGGAVDMMAAQSAALYGAASARGGATGGNGGTIRTMATTLDLNGFRADASATNGTAGTWTIWTNPAVMDDPLVTSIEQALNNNTKTVLNTYTDIFTPAPTSLVINQDIVKTTAGAASLTLNAGGSMTVAQGVTVGASSTGGTVDVSLNAHPASAGALAIQLATGASIVTHGGTLALAGDTGQVTVAGLLDASATGAGAQGGAATLSGANVTLTSGRIDTRGDAGGGNVGITATTVSVQDNATIFADAFTRGTGGNVTLQATGQAQVDGTVTTQGGAGGGNGGAISLLSTAGAANLNGVLDASAPGAGGIGGTVAVRGATVALQDASYIFARGDAGGGTVNVFASDSTANPAAPTLAMASSAVIQASAANTGTGGAVDLMAAESAALHGTVFARGGATGGNGGTIRTMATTLALDGFMADASAANGAAGTWTIWTNPAVLDDPLVTSIELALYTNTNTVLNTYTDVFTPAATSLAINQSIVKTNAGAASLTLNAGGAITMAQGVTVGASSTGGKVDVTFNAHPVGSSTAAVTLDDGSAIVTHGGAIGLTGGTGTVTVAGLLDASATGAGAQGGAATLSGANVTLTSGRIDTRGDAGGGAVGITATTLSVQDGATILADAFTRGAGGNVTLQATGQAQVDGTVTTQGGAGGGNGGAISLLSTAGPANLNGVLDASAPGAGGIGGTVAVRGATAGLGSGSYIFARGDAGGGTVNVFATNSTANPAAPTLTMANSAVIQASATNTGTGGAVDLMAAESAALHGTVFARGGATGGNGGTIRTMATTLALDTFLADASAANGAAGTWTIWTNPAVLDDPLVTSIELALNTNTNTVLNTYADSFTPLPTTLTVNQDIRKTSAGSASLTLNANGNVVVGEGVTIGTTTPGSQLDVTLNATQIGGGAVILEDRAAILTNGGAINLNGGNATVFASRNETAYAQGVSLTNATLDSRVGRSDTGAGGDITIAGQGSMVALDSTANRAGIALNNSAVNSGSGAITMTGTGGLAPAGGSAGRVAGDGIDVEIGDTSTTITSSSNHITLTGVAGGNGATGDVTGGTGVLLNLYDANGIQVFSANQGDIAVTGTAYAASGTGTQINGGLYANGDIKVTGLALGAAQTGLYTTNLLLSAPTGGSVSLLGRSDNGIGANLNSVRIKTAAGADGQGDVVVAGESAVAANGLSLYGLWIGGAAMSGNVSISALNGSANAAGAAPMINVVAGQFDVPDTLNSITTTGVINFRPGGVSASGALTDAFGVPITVGAAAANPFHIALADFHLGSAARVVVGSSGQTGAITYADAGQLNGNLTLQNDGAGSGGITITTPLQATGLVTLSSGGKVVGNAAVTSAGLLLHGAGPASSFQLTNAGNAVGTLAAVFDTPRSTADASAGSVDVVNSGALTLGSLAGDTADAGKVTATDSVVAGYLRVRTTGPLTLAQNLSTSSGNLTLVTGTVLNNAAGKTLSAGGGAWQVFANTWLGEARGGLAGAQPQPNLYNCAYGAACSANVAGNRFVYVQQPTVTVTGDALSRIYGDANPALTYTATGLINGDTLASALAGGYATAATRASNVGNYATTGSFTSPDGYLVQALAGSLAIDRAALVVAAADQSKVYGAADPQLTASYTGLKGDDTGAVVTGLTLSTATGAAATAGTHAITAADGVAQNYTIAYRPGTLTVAKSLLTVSADSKEKEYGAADPALSASVSGLQYADTRDVLSGLVLTAPQGAAATAGTHAITASAASAANYIVQYAPGVLTVTPAVLTYVADPTTQFAGAPALPTAGTVTGFVYGDALGTATTGALAFTNPATLASAPGTYAVQGGGLASANYRFVQAPTNTTALVVLANPVVDLPTVVKDVTFETSNVYTKNVGTPRVCVATGSFTGSGNGDSDDPLAMEWTRVRVSPNLSNCLSMGQRNSCQDF